jgi:two-component system OmpR family response regulator
MAELAGLLATGLRTVGFEARIATSVTLADAVGAIFDPQVVLLDAATADAVEVRHLLRDRPDTEFILLTQRDRARDRGLALAVGARDRIAKPFSVEAVVAGVRAALRRARCAAGSSPTAGITTLHCGDLELDEVTHEVRRGGREIKLTPRQYALLHYLLLQRGRVVSKPQILAHVWGYDFAGGPWIVDDYLSQLRNKIDRDRPPFIQTLRGIGCALRVADVVPAEVPR